jgi:hypothetical protein
MKEMNFVEAIAYLQDNRHRGFRLPLKIVKCPHSYLVRYLVGYSTGSIEVSTQINSMGTVGLERYATELQNPTLRFVDESQAPLKLTLEDKIRELDFGCNTDKVIELMKFIGAEPKEK